MARVKTVVSQVIQLAASQHRVLSSHRIATRTKRIARVSGSLAPALAARAPLLRCHLPRRCHRTATLPTATAPTCMTPTRMAPTHMPPTRIAPTRMPPAHTALSRMMCHNKADPLGHRVLPLAPYAQLISVARIIVPFGNTTTM